MSQSTPKLRWLFVAFFEDGHIIEQDPEDTCRTRTDGSGNTYTDVQEYEKKSPLIAFELRHTETKEVVTIDLKTGAFVINGTPFIMHGQHFEPLKYKLKLIRFYETRAEQDISIETGGVVDERHYINRYFIGWETIVNGKNKQYTLAVG